MPCRNLGNYRILSHRHLLVIISSLVDMLLVEQAGSNIKAYAEHILHCFLFGPFFVLNSNRCLTRVHILAKISHLL